MKQPLVSICISCYNHEKYVKQALEGAINQTYPNIQILVSDDGSTDRSRDIILEVAREHPDKDIRLFLSETNTTFAVMEEIYQKAEGDYIAGFSADDLWGETVVAKYVEFMEQHEEYAAAFTVPEMIWDGVRKSKSPFIACNIGRHKLFEAMFCYGNCICAPSMIIRKEVWREMDGYRFCYRQLQDYALWLKILQKYEIWFFENGEIPIYYRVHGNNLSFLTQETRQRDSVERMYMMLDLMEHMDETFFLKAFDDRIVHPADSEKYCLTCEKFMVLLHAESVDQNSVIMYYFRHIEEADFADHIERDYGFSRKDFHSLTGQMPARWERLLQLERDNRMETIESQNKMINNLMQKIQYLLNTRNPEKKRKSNIILITDAIHSKMILETLSADTCVMLYLDFENYAGKSGDEQQADKEEFTRQLGDISSRIEEVDYIFSFIYRHEMSPKEELADWVLAELDRLNIPKYKVYDGFRIYRSFYPKERYARVLSNPDIDKLDGMVFGASCAEAGIRSSFLPGKVANFSSPMQDIFFNYFTAKKIWEHFPQKVSGLKYVVIGISDYTCLHFETMLASEVFEYFQNSGLECPEIFDEMEDKKLDASAEEINTLLRSRQQQVTSTQKAVFSQIFGDLRSIDENAYCDYPVVDRRRKLNQEKLAEYDSNSDMTPMQKNISRDSLERNVRYFCEFLNFLRTENRDLVIFVCMMPKYQAAVPSEEKIGSDAKDYFEKILDEIKKENPFIYLNCKEDVAFLRNPDYYWDMTHLNHNGSEAFTKKLAEEICKYVDVN